MTSIYDVLKASKGIHVDDTFAELWGRKLSNAYTVETYTGTLPATLQTVEGHLESYKIYGSTVQDGTPTPENPIVPSGCGVRTENLFEVESDMLSSLNWELNPPLAISNKTYFINYKLSDAVTQELKKGEHTCSIFRHFTDGYTPNLLVCAFCPTITPTIDQEYRILTNQGATFTRTFDFSEWQDIYLTIGFGEGFQAEKTKQSKIDELFTNWEISIVKGSTAPDQYIPYGFKLPLTVNGVEYPIYLGESQSTRKIKKLVLTGKENFSKNTTSSSNYLYYSPRNGLLPNSIEKTPLVCNELPVINEAPVSQIGISSNNGFNVIYINFGADVMNTQPSGNTADGLKEYLAAQYAAGTPVTVWYVLAEPETAVVNEPLMKIGDYADTIDSKQANVQIPTAAGTTTIGWAGEGLAPSEVELTYRKPKGQ